MVIEDKSAFFSNKKKEEAKEEKGVFGLRFLEPIKETPRQSVTRSPARPTHTPRNDGDVGFPDVDF